MVPKPPPSLLLNYIFSPTSRDLEVPTFIEIQPLIYSIWNDFLSQRTLSYKD